MNNLNGITMHQIYYYIRPIFIFGLCFSYQSICLHLATRQYLLYMKNNSKWELVDIVEDSLVSLLKSNHIDIPIQILDLIGIIPMISNCLLISIAIYYKYDVLSVLNKTFLIGSILAVIKGTLDIVTILPDSNGYEHCKVRLGPDTITFLTNLNFDTKFFKSFYDLLITEIFGINNDHQHMRYCSDMLLSGHTYFVVLFSIASYKMITIINPDLNQSSRRLIQVIILIYIGLEVLLILISKFHYTVDILIAIVLVLLLWDSSLVNNISQNLVTDFEILPDELDTKEDNLI